MDGPRCARSVRLSQVPLGGSIESIGSVGLGSGLGPSPTNSKFLIFLLEEKAGKAWGIFRWSFTTPKIPKILLEVKDSSINLE